MRSHDRKIPGQSERTPGHAPRWAVTLGLMTLFGGNARAQDLDLSAPIGATGPAVELPPPALVKPLAPPASAPAPAAASRRSVLALPGITTPTTPPPAARPSATADLELPDLDAPMGMNQAPPPARATSPIVIESLPSQMPAITEPSPSPTRSPVRRDPAPVRSTPARTPSPAASNPAQARRPWWFALGRPGPAPAGASAAVTGPRSNASMPGAGRDSTIEGGKEGKPDPTAEVALQKRLERQARALVGDRARAVEVRVSGKQVAIEARGVRMFQKRNVRRALETMPSLSGYRSSVSVLD